MSEPPPGYDPRVTSFTGGENVTIERVMGGGGMENSNASTEPNEPQVGGQEDTLPSVKELSTVLRIPHNGRAAPLDALQARHIMETATFEEKLIAQLAVKKAEERMIEHPPTVEELQELPYVAAESQVGGQTLLTPQQKQNLLAEAAIRAIIEKRNKMGELTRPEDVQAAYERVAPVNQQLRHQRKPSDVRSQESEPAVVTLHQITPESYPETTIAISQPVNVEQFKKELTTLIEMYARAVNSYWNVSFSDPSIGNRGGHKPPSIKEGTNIRSVDFPQLIYCLSSSTSEIIVAPSIAGNFTKFASVIGKLQDSAKLSVKDKKITIKKGVVIVFTPPFYTNDDASNKSLLLGFLRIQTANPGQIFVLTDPTPDGYINAIKINKFTHVQKRLITMFEPSYIVYPYKRNKANGILITNNDMGGLPGPTDPKLYSTLAQFTRSSQYGKKTTIVYKTSTDGPSQVVQYAQIVSTTNGPTQESGELVNGTKSQYEDTLIRIELKNDTDARNQNGILFMSSLEANDDPRSVKQRTIELNGNYYDIRISDPYHNNVYDNWLHRLYTPHEAAFLNELNLRPYILPQIPEFNNDWESEVAMFLRNIVLSKCFSDESIMTNRECQQSRRFIRAVIEYYAVNGITDASIAGSEKEAFDSQQKIIQNKIERTLQNAPKPDVEGKEFVGLAPASKEEKRDKRKTIRFITDALNNKKIVYVTVIHKQTGFQSVRKMEIDVGLNDEDATKELEAKIEELKKKNPQYIFVE